MKTENQLQRGAKWTFIVLVAASVIVLVRMLSLASPKVSEETSPVHEDEQLRSRFYKAPLARVVSAAQAALQAQKTFGRSWHITGYDSSTGETQQIHVEVPIVLLTDDLTVTLKHAGDGDIRVDCTSGSRVSSVDFGQNKRNITQFLAALDAILKR